VFSLVTPFEGCVRGPVKTNSSPLNRYLQTTKSPQIKERVDTSQSCSDQRCKRYLERANNDLLVEPIAWFSASSPDPSPHCLSTGRSVLGEHRCSAQGWRSLPQAAAASESGPRSSARRCVVAAAGRARGHSITHGWTLRPVGNVVVVVGAAAAAAPARVRPVRSGVVFPLPKMRLQTVPMAAAISA